LYVNATKFKNIYDGIVYSVNDMMDIKLHNYDILFNIYHDPHYIEKRTMYRWNNCIILFVWIFRPKFVHFFTIPMNVALSMMFLAQFKLGLDESMTYASEFVFDINASLILMLILVLLYITIGLIRRCPAWGFATSCFIFLLWGAVC